MPREARRASPFLTRTTPQSYPALGHLCASVAQESAFSNPWAKGAYLGETRAQRPNAPSTWTQAPCSFAAAQIWSAGSKAPVFTLPA